MCPIGSAVLTYTNRQTSQLFIDNIQIYKDNIQKYIDNIQIYVHNIQIILEPSTKEKVFVVSNKVYIEITDWDTLNDQKYI